MAALARLKLTDTEQDEMVEHFDKILTYVDKLGELDTDKVEPTAHAVEVSAPLREDRVTHPALQYHRFHVSIPSILLGGSFPSRSGPREEHEGPKGTQGPPKGAPRCPKAPPRCPNGGLLGAVWGAFSSRMSSKPPLPHL